MIDPDDDVTPARRPSSIQRVSRWAMVEVWLGQAPGRSLLMTVGARGLRVVVVDEARGERIEDVLPSEDPSAAALRAIERLHEAPR